MGKKAFRLYRIKDQTFRADVVYTNTAIGGAPAFWTALQHPDNVDIALGLAALMLFRMEDMLASDALVEVSLAGETIKPEHVEAGNATSVLGG